MTLADNEDLPPAGAPSTEITDVEFVGPRPVNGGNGTIGPASNQNGHEKVKASAPMRAKDPGARVQSKPVSAVSGVGPPLAGGD
jgi:hypothetical protein